MWTDARWFFIEYCLFHCGSEKSRATYGELTWLDKIGLAHDPRLVTSALRRAIGDIARRAGNHSSEATDCVDDALQRLIKSSCVNEVYSEWCGTRDRPTISRFEAAILGH